MNYDEDYAKIKIHWFLTDFGRTYTKGTDWTAYGQTMKSAGETALTSENKIKLESVSGTEIATISVQSGTVAEGQNGFTTGDTMYKELRPAENAEYNWLYQKNKKTTADSLVALDTAIGKLTESGKPTYLSADEGKQSVFANLQALDAKAVRTTGYYVDENGDDRLDKVIGNDEDPTVKGQHITKDNKYLIANDGSVLATIEVGEGGGDSVVDYVEDKHALSTDLDVGVATGTNSTAYGYNASASAEGSVALGKDASVDAAATNSVALGAGSVASAENTVSVGSATQTRKIVNVAAGEDATDAATYGQLIVSATAATKDTTSGVQTATLKHGDTSIADLNIAIAGEGEVAADDKGLLDGATVYAYVNPADGKYVKSGETTAANLTALDTKIGTEVAGNYYAKGATVEAKLFALDKKIGIFTTAQAGAYTYLKANATVSANLLALDDKAIKANADDATKADDKKTGQVINTKNKKLLANDGTVLATIEVGEGGGDSVVDYDEDKHALSTDLDVGVATGTNSTAYGYNASASAEGSVAIGYGSVADVANTFSVGASGSERRIVNVAAGINDTDAVNFSQINIKLLPTITKSKWGVTTITGPDGTKWKGNYIYSTLNEDGTVNENGTLSAIINTLNAKAVAANQTISKDRLTLYANDGTALCTFTEYGSAGGISVDASGVESVALGYESAALDSQVVQDTTDISTLKTQVSGSDTKNDGVKLADSDLTFDFSGGEESVTQNVNYSDGTSKAFSITISGISGGMDSKVIGDTTKLTEKGLGDTVTDSILNVNDKLVKEGSYAAANGKVEVKNNAGNVAFTITGLDTTAVDLGDTTKLSAAGLGNNVTDSILTVNDKVGVLSDDINEVGAGAAALSALHPEGFSPDDKWSFAVGYGHYKNANAGALGAFFKPNADMTVSLGGTLGNGDPMMNAGVSFKLGSRGKNAGTFMNTRELVQRMDRLEAAGVKESNRNDAQDRIIAAQAQEIRVLKAQVAELMKKIELVSSVQKSAVR